MYIRRFFLRPPDNRSQSTSCIGEFIYVSIAGNDMAAGTAAAPWRTLQHAAECRQSLAIRSPPEPQLRRLLLDTSGTAAAPIKSSRAWRASSHQRNATTPDGINLEGASYVVIDGFSISGMPQRRRAIPWVFPTILLKFVTVRNVTATNNGNWGIFTGMSTIFVIESNTTSVFDQRTWHLCFEQRDRPIIRNNVSLRQSCERHPHERRRQPRRRWASSAARS